MNQEQYRQQAALAIEKERGRLQILVGTDQMTPDTARARLKKFKEDLAARAGELQLLKGWK